MENKMADKPVARPTFFEIFKARCSESDLGPISLNWFEELSTEALPYESETSERPEYRAVCLEQSASKTPRGKPFTCSQLASTPVIFKEQSITLPLLSSPIKELGQKKTETGKDSLVNKDHRSSPHFMKTKLDQISPLNTSLSISSAALRGIYRTPQRNNIPVARGSLFCTPKLLEVKTPTCISEGLGAEVDPDMSWSSSLATPPTLSATVIIARGNDSISGAKQHDERIAMVLHSFFSSHGKRPEKNDVNVLSIPEIVNINAGLDGKDHELEKILDGSFGEMNSLENRSGRNQITQNSLEDGERNEMRIDMPDAGEHVLSVCHTSGEHLQDVTMTNWTKKTHFDKMATILLQETNEIRGNFKDASSVCERELDSPRCEIFTTNMSNNRIPKLLENRKFTKEDMPSTFTSEWSQLNLSGLDVTQLEKNSTSDKYSPSSFCNKKRSENKLHANLSTFETSLLNTSSLIKAEKLLNINWSEHMEDETKNYEKHSTSETSIMHSVDLSVQDPSLVKVCAAEKVSEVHFLDCSSFLMENTNFTGYTEVCTSCFHKELKELSKSSITDVTSHPVLCNDSIPSNPDGTKWSTNNESTPVRSCLKNTSLLSSLKKRSKRFIYTINNASPRQEEKVKKEIKAGPSIHSASSRLEFESCPFKSPDMVSNDDQDLLVSSAERKSLKSNSEESFMLLSKYATRADRIDNSPNSSLKNKMIHLDILKSNRREHQPASSLDCSETSNTLKECLVVSSNSNNVLSVEHKVIATACLRATKHSEMDFVRTEHVVQWPKKDEMEMYGNVNPHNDTVILQTFKNQLGEPSSDNEQLVEIEQEQVSMKNRYFNDTSINCDIHKHNSVCCNRTKSEDENDATGLLPTDEWKTVTLPPLIIQSNKNSSTTTLIRESKKDTVQFSKVIVADQETESIENGDNNLQTPSNNNMVTIESSEKLFDHNNCGSLQAVISDKSTLPQLALKIGPEQIVSDFVTKAPEPNVEDKDFVKKVITFPSKRVTSDKYLYSKNHLCLDIKSKENPEDKEKWSGDTNFNGQCLNKCFGGFQTASNKQIKVSEKSITKGKMLFKDMEDECLKDFSGEGIKNISNQITKKNINIVNNKLDTNYSHGLDSQASLIESKNAQSIVPESTDSSLQSLHRNQPHQLNQTLTASQEAEITELSNILEETNSQFEFTQFRKQSNMVQNNSSQLSGCVDKNETTNLKDISAMWQDTDLDYISETEAQRVNDKSSSKHTDINEESTEMGNVNEEREIFQKNNCVEFTSTNLCRNANKIPLVSSFSVSTQDNFSNFAGFSSAGGKKINISNEALIRAAKLFSNLDAAAADDDDMFKPTEINSRSHYSDRYKTSRRDVSRCVAEGDSYCGESVKDANIEYQNTLKNNEENINTFMKIYGENQGENTTNISENDRVSSSTKISNLGVIKYSVYKMENGLSSSENNNPSLNISKKLHESDTQSQYSLQEGLSDLTCLAEVSKTEEILTLNISDDPSKSEQKIKNVDFRTASSSNRSVSQAPLDKFHLFETCTEKELNNISSNSNSQMTHSINKKERNATSRKRNINVNQNKSRIGSGHQQISIQQDTDFERKNIEENNGFHTANGKKIIITDESLSKAKQFFAEENVCPENMDNIGNFEDSEFHPCNKDFIKDCEEFAENTPNYDQEMLTLTVGDQGVKFVGPGSTSALRKSEVVISQKRDPKPELISKTTFGFNTASGKRVLVSENAFQKVKQVFNNSKYHFADRLSSRQDPVIALKSSINYAGANKATDTVCLKPKIQDTHNEELDLTNSYPVEIKALQNICNIEIPVCVPRSEKDEHLTLINSFTFAEDTQLFKKEHHSLTRMEIEAVSCNTPTKTKLDVFHLKCSQSSEEYLETEAVESAKAFMEDKFTNSGIENDTKKSLFICRKIDKNCPLNIRTGKRHMEERASLGEPPIKRQLLPEFDRTENPHKSLKASKSTPDGMIKDRRKFMYHIPLKPETCVPFSATKERQEIKNPNITVLDQDFKGYKPKSDVFQHHLLRQSLSGSSGFFTPFKKISTEESEKRKNLPLLSKTAKTFVPPFKVKSAISTHQHHVSKRLDSLINTTMNRDKELKDITMQQSTSETEVQSQEKDYTKQVAPCNLRNNVDGDSDLMEMIANLHYVRNLQEMRIRKKQRQNIHPQPGNLYLMKTSAAKRISLKAAVEEKTPSTYSMEQLYMYGVSKDCIKVNSINAESFQFLILDFFSKEYLVAERGIQLADGGWLIPTDKGMAGKEEFYRALCDTPGVDPKLITEAWVYNHYRWIVWKLAAMEVSFPQEFANRCLTPERVLFQLKYRYDLEIDKSQRSAIKKIVERDDTPAKTLILCVSKIILLNANMPDVCSNKTIVENKKEAAIIEVTDGWYCIRALLDPPLQALLHGRRLTVGQKIIVHGAELVGSQDACTPLEIPDSLMLKISANSTRRARWHAKLGFHQDPRPFPLPLSSLFGEGGTVGCIDIVIQRTYPIQWVEKMPTGSYVFRNGRAEEREAAKHAENRQKHLEALFSQIQMEFEQHEDKPHKRALRSHTLTREQIRILEDGAELYEVIQNASDPSYVEGYLSEEQLKALNTHRQILNDKKQSEIQAEFKKAIESAEREERGCSKRDVSTVWKLRVIDYRKRETDKAIILSIWRPLSDICSLLKEGGRYRIYQLTASRSKGKPDAVNCTLTATKKTQYLQLQASQEVLLEIYIPRKALQFSMLLDPSFRPSCAEVDLVGFIISVSKKTGFTTLVYLSDEDHNLVAIKFWTDLKQLAIEDIINPFTLISASNLQWRSEFKSDIPTLFAGDLSIFSASPKDSYLQERLNKLKNTTENLSCFCSDAEHKLMKFLQKNSPQQYNLPKECGLDPLSPSWKSGLDTGNKPLISSPSSEIKCQSSLSTSKHDLKLVLRSSAKMTPHISYSKESPKNCKKRRKALDLLSQIPSPPPVTPINSFVSPSLKKAFQPPRSSGVQYDASLKRTNHNSDHINSFKGVNETDSLPNNDLVADEELAMINTQVLLYNFQEGKKTDCVGESTNPSDHLLLKNNCLMSLMETKTSQNSTDGAAALEKDTRETEGSLPVQKKLQRQRKRKCY
uniref:BRCA2 DNA repair associated n=1 Tax=Pelodiscus sinensis TaxID=13735 RepID=K7FXU8_PELSI